MQGLIGQDIGRYHIVEQLGEGGMATVYKAYDTRLERNVAIKVIRSDQAHDTAFHRRFEREAKSLAGLSHSNIVKVLDYGEYNDAPYVVMEYLPGGTLKSKLGRPIPWMEAAQILTPIARALDYAHHHKIIHRDVKPANILINESGQPMLSDFGIAKILESEGTTQLTGTGVGIGTPEYMAPEQGYGKLVDPRADVYSLGVVFYELVTGRRPFRADTPMAVMLKHMTDPLPAPRSFIPDLPDGVEKVIFKALAKEPENRFQDMGAFADALEALGRGRSVSPVSAAQVPKPVVRPPQPARKSNTWILPVGIAGGLIVVVIVCVLLGTLGYPYLKARSLGTQIAGEETVTAPGGETQGEETLTVGENVSSRQKMVWGNGVSNQVTYTPDGKQIAVATTLGIDLLDAQTLEHVKTYRHGVYTGSVDVSPDGTLVAGGTTSSVLIWNLQNDELFKTFEGFTANVGSVDFSLDGAYFAAASSDGTIRLWQTSDWSLKREWQSLPISSSTYNLVLIEFSPDGALLVAANQDASIRVWQVGSGEQLYLLQGQAIGPQVFLNGMSVSADGKYVAAGVNNQLTVWNLSDGSPVDIPVSAMMSLANLVFSPDGSVMAVTTYQGGINILETSTWNIANPLNSSSSWGEDIIFSPDGSQLFVSGGYSKTEMELWRVADATLVKLASRYNSLIANLAISADGKSVAAAFFGNVAELYQMEDGRVLQHYEGGESLGAKSFVFISADSSKLAYVYDGEAKIYQISDGALLNTVILKDVSPTCAALSPDWQFLAAGSYNKGVQVVRLNDGMLMGTLQGQSGTINGVAFSPDGKLLASAAGDQSVSIWSAGDWSLLRTLTGHTNAVTGVAFSADNSTLASSADDNTVKLWRVMDGVLMQTLQGHVLGVKTVSFSPDGERLASGSVDNTVRVWKVDGGSLLVTLEGHTSGVSSVAFTPDGETLVSGSFDGTVRVWDVSQ